MRTLKKVTMDGIKRPAKYTTPDELEIAASVDLAWAHIHRIWQSKQRERSM
jgi:hypothetical protein